MHSAVKEKIDSDNILSSFWCGLDWTSFIPFNFDQSYSNGPGLYRVRVSGKSELAYIGQTGRNLKERVRELIRNTLADKMPFNDPHTAAPRLWSYMQETGMQFEVSTASYTSTKQQRMCMESYLIWSYRKQKRKSPLCNFGRLHPNYLPSRKRSTGVRGKRVNQPCADSNFSLSASVLELVSEPSNADWMGVNWSKPAPLQREFLKFVPDSPGIYRLLETKLPIYYGEASKLKLRLKSHSGKWTQLTHFSYASFDEYKTKHLRLEVENDLIAGHFSFCAESPANQFKPLNQSK
jgi:hypothetical protein